MIDSTSTIQSNFAFLAKHSPHLVKLAAQAERYLADDPNTCLIKLRQDELMGKIERFIEALLDDFYGDSGVDWRTALDGESISLFVELTAVEGDVMSLTFKADGVRQAAPPKPFNAKRCAWSVKQALEHRGAKEA